MTVIGIDPGQKGALAVLHLSSAKVVPFGWDAYIREIDAANANGCVVAVVEDVHAMPKQGVTSMFSFGENKGIILGILKHADVDTVLVSPQKWKKYYGLGHDKQDSIRLCRRLFPSTSLYPTARCRKESDGMAEAVLIANWYIQTHQKEMG